MGINAFGFVYIWHDRATGKFYIGSHYGPEDDGYVCSSKWMLSAFRRRPHDFRRRILERLYEDDKSLILDSEQRWLSLIKDHELSTSDAVRAETARYYNHKKLARGGSRKGHTKNRTTPSWSKGTTKEMQRLRREGLFCFLIDAPKQKQKGANNNRKGKRAAEDIRLVTCPICETDFTTNTKRAFCSRSCSSVRVITPEQKEAISRKKKGLPAWNRGLSNPQAAENGRSGAEKMRARAIGRTRLYLDDGSWTWQYMEGLPRP